MIVSVDLSELETLAQTLADVAPVQAARAVRAVTIAEGRTVKSQAKAAAPRDRPWLATQGIRMKTWKNEDNVAASIYVTPDPEGRDVGLYVEFGTSDTAPQPFLGPAIAGADKTYPAAILAAVEPLADTPGPDVQVGGEE